MINNQLSTAAGKLQQDESWNMMELGELDQFQDVSDWMIVGNK